MRMETLITILIATAVFNSVSVLPTFVLSNVSSSAARKAFPLFDLQKDRQKSNLSLLTDDSNKNNFSEDGFSTERRQRPMHSQIPPWSRSRSVSKTDEPASDQLFKSSISDESWQNPLIGQIPASSRHRTALRVDAMKTDKQTEGVISTESKQHPSPGQIPTWSRHRTTTRIDDSEAGQWSKDSLSAESRQRPSSGQIPSWSNPPNVPWTDDPPSGDSLSLLPILYLLAPLVVTAMLMPIGATLITAIVMMKAHHQAAQGRLKSLFPEEDRIGPVYKLFEKNLQDLWQKFEEAIAKYNHGDMEHRRKL